MEVLEAFQPEEMLGRAHGSLIGVLLYPKCRSLIKALKSFS